MADLLNYLKRKNFAKRLIKLKRQLNNKSVIIYGAGKLFRIIMDNYDLSNLNSIGVCDKSFSTADEASQIFGYPQIALHN